MVTWPLSSSTLAHENVLCALKSNYASLSHAYKGGMFFLWPAHISCSTLHSVLEVIGGSDHKGAMGCLRRRDLHRSGQPPSQVSHTPVIVLACCTSVYSASADSWVVGTSVDRARHLSLFLSLPGKVRGDFVPVHQPRLSFSDSVRIRRDSGKQQQVF